MTPNTAPARSRSLTSESGSVLILTALSMVLLLGIMAFAIDGSYMYTERNRMHAAADAAAKSGAWEVYTGSGADLQAFANREAVWTNFDPGGATSVVVNNPPASGPHAGNPKYVEAIVSRPTDTFFARVMGFLTVTPAARAVAGTSSGPSCIIALQQTGTSMTVGGTVTVNLPGCNIHSNGNLSHGNGVGSINAATTAAASCTGSCGGIIVNAPPVEDPFVADGRPDPPTPNPYSGPPTSYTLAPSGPASDTLSPGWYSKIDIANNKTVTFLPGTYWLTGPFLVGNSAVLSGTGLFFYLQGPSAAGPCLSTSTAGCIDIPNGATVSFSAMTAGPTRGILFWQARDNALDANFNNAGNYDLSGAMYFPASTVTYGNSGASNDCTLFVANVINMSPTGGGSTTVNFANTCSLYGGSPILTVSLAE